MNSYHKPLKPDIKVVPARTSERIDERFRCHGCLDRYFYPRIIEQIESHSKMALLECRRCNSHIRDVGVADLDSMLKYFQSGIANTEYVLTIKKILNQNPDYFNSDLSAEERRELKTELEAVAKSRGYKMTWVWHQLKDRGALESNHADKSQ